VLIHVVDFSGKTDIEGEATEGHDPREDIDFLEEELDAWYLDVLEKGLEKFETRYHGADAAIEEELADQMSAFGIDKDRMKRVILAEGLELDPDTWDETDRVELAREIRKRTKPMVIAANKMDTPEAQANWAEITSDPDYDHLSFVPASAHAEKALKNADDAGVVDYTPGDDAFEVVGDVSGEQKAGLDQIGEFVDEYDGTGVQGALEAAVFDVLGCIAVFPGSANGSSDEKGVFRDCFILPEGSTTEDFAYHIHSDIGEGLLHGTDCRSGRQVGTDNELSHRDVIELISTKQAAP